MEVSKTEQICFVGLPCVGAFLLVLFTVYYPFVNKKIVNVKFECGAVYLKGDSVNYSKLGTARGINYDSLSVSDPAIFVQQTDCDPSVAWTFGSIEHNFNGIIWRYITTIVLFSVGIFS